MRSFLYKFKYFLFLHAVVLFSLINITFVLISLLSLSVLKTYFFADTINSLFLYQIIGEALIIFGSFLLLKKSKFKILFLLLSAFFLIFLLFSYLFEYNKFDQEEFVFIKKDIDILSWNVRYYNNEPQEFLEIIENTNPKVIYLTELSKKFEDGISLIEEQGYIKYCQRNSGWGSNCFYNNTDIQNFKIVSAKGHYAILKANFNINNQVHTVYGVHLAAPTNKYYFNIRTTMWDELEEDFKKERLKRDDIRKIIVGDFNTENKSYYLNKFLENTQTIDFSTTHHKPVFTYSGGWGLGLFKLHIDRILSYKGNDIQIEFEKIKGSDHKVLLADINTNQKIHANLKDYIFDSLNWTQEERGKLFVEHLMIPYTYNDYKEDMKKDEFSIFKKRYSHGIVKSFANEVLIENENIVVLKSKYDYDIDKYYADCINKNCTNRDLDYLRKILNNKNSYILHIISKYGTLSKTLSEAQINKIIEQISLD